MEIFLTCVQVKTIQVLNPENQNQEAISPILNIRIHAKSPNVKLILERKMIDFLVFISHIPYNYHYQESIISKFETKENMDSWSQDLNENRSMIM